MVEQKAIPPDEAARIILFEESHYLDVKAIELKPAKISRSVSAFANTAGGEIFLGIDETELEDGSKRREWRGFADMEAANAVFQVLESLGSLGNHYTASFLTSKGLPGHVLQITIPKSKNIVNSTEGIPYKRRVAQNLPVDTEEGLQRLKLDKGVVTFEDETVPIPHETVTNSETMIRFMLEVVPSGEPLRWLESQFLWSNYNPTVAGVLLFADEPQAALPKRSAIKVFRYKSREDEGTRETLAADPITIEGCAYTLISRAVEITKQMVEQIKALGLRGLEHISYPEETLHEIVTNAVLHRDYSIPADIQIRIYDNRIEVESPGKLPGHVTLQNILVTQSARNPKLIRIMTKFPNAPNKDVGEGLNTAFEAMKRLRLKTPELVETENSVVVYLDHSPLGSPEDAVMEYLQTHNEITNRAGREITGIRSENTMKEVFYRLAKRDMIERVPEKQGNLSAWRIATGAAAPAAPERGLFDNLDDATGGDS